MLDGAQSSPGRTPLERGAVLEDDDCRVLMNRHDVLDLESGVADCFI